jgi:hypothetical protein
MGSKGCAQPAVTEREILDLVTPLLRQVTLTTGERERCVEAIHELNHHETEGASLDLDRLRSKQSELVRLNGRLLDLYIAGDLSKEDKETKSAEYAERRKALDLQISQAQRGEKEWIELCERFFESLTDATNVFDAANEDEKRQLLRSLEIELRATPEKLLLNAGNATTIVRNRGRRPVWRTLVEEVRTALAAKLN